MHYLAGRIKNVSILISQSKDIDMPYLRSIQHALEQWEKWAPKNTKEYLDKYRTARDAKTVREHVYDQHFDQTLEDDFG